MNFDFVDARGSLTLVLIVVLYIVRQASNTPIFPNSIDAGQHHDDLIVNKICRKRETVHAAAAIGVCIVTMLSQVIDNGVGE